MIPLQSVLRNKVPGLAMAGVVAIVLASAGFAKPQSSTKPGGNAGVKRSPAQEQHDWPAYGGTADNNHYSSLAQINRTNVKQLALAWSFDSQEEGGLQSTPIVVEGVLYGITPTQKVFALDAVTGRLFWKFDSGIKGTQPDRGLAYWTQGNDKRILVGVMNFVYALNATTGRAIATFGRHGRIDLRDNLGREPATSQSVDLTSPGIVYQDLLIVGGRNPETPPSPPGDVRAFDVRTGKLRWSFHTIPHPGEFGRDTWPREAWKTAGAANNWAGMAVDARRGIVYVPTGSAVPDFYGGDRVGDDLFANCLIALKAQTGERIWHFQAVRHDIWDRDFPASPVLLTVKRDGKDIDAVAQTTKQGFVYLFDRTNGAPLFPDRVSQVSCQHGAGRSCRCRTAASHAPGALRPAGTERGPAHQSNSRGPPVGAGKIPHLPQRGPVRSHQHRKRHSGLSRLRRRRGMGRSRGRSRDGHHLRELERNGLDGRSRAEHGENSAQGIYLSQCGVCHGEKMMGSPPAIPALVSIGDRLTPQQITATITAGKGRMPGFPNLSEDQISALVTYLTSGESKELSAGGPPTVPMKFRFTGYHKFLDPDGYPAVLPPWGTLNAINLNTGEYAWKIPLGQYPELAAQGLINTGTENYGGPIVTAGGLVFIGATNFDKKFRAFDKATGELLWEATLPFAGNATPITYEVKGRQFVVIAAGGGKDPKSSSGGVYVAFALPR